MMKIAIIETENLHSFYRYNGHGKKVFMVGYNKKIYTLAECKRMFKKQHNETIPTAKTNQAGN